MNISRERLPPAFPRSLRPPLLHPEAFKFMASTDALESTDPVQALSSRFGSPSPRTLHRSSQSLPRSPPGWLHFVAGGLGGMAGAVVTAPFDLVKTRLQSSDSLHRSLASSRTSVGTNSVFEKLFHHFTDTGKIIRDIHHHEGIRALFRGLGPTLVGAIPARAINFYVYGNGKEFYAQLLGQSTSHTSTRVHMYSAITAGIATATATNPVWVVKTRLQLERSLHLPNPLGSPCLRRGPSASHQTLLHEHSHSNPKNQSSILPSTRPYSAQPNLLPNSIDTSAQCIAKIYQQDGILGFYRGMSASYLGVAEGTIQWILYEKLKALGTTVGDEEPGSRPQSWLSKTWAAGAAKLVATGLTYPHEVIRTRLRQKPPPPPLKPKYTGLLSTFKIIVAEEGPKALYGGMSAHLLRVVPNAVVMYTVYECMLSVNQKLNSQ